MLQQNHVPRLHTVDVDDPHAHLQATALVGYEVGEVCQSEAVPEVKQGHDVQRRH